MASGSKCVGVEKCVQWQATELNAILCLRMCAFTTHLITDARTTTAALFI